jgi:hypothetical protein
MTDEPPETHEKIRMERERQKKLRKEIGADIVPSSINKLALHAEEVLRSFEETTPAPGSSCILDNGGTDTIQV